MTMTNDDDTTRSAPSRWLSAVAALSLALLLTGCGDLFTVTNPGQLQDDDLNNQEGLTALVVGLHYDFSQATDNMAFDISRLSDEMAGSGSYFSTGRLRRGIVDREDANGAWNTAQQARWVAEDAIRRLQEVAGEDFGNNQDLAAEAYLHAGLANRMLGEDFCQVAFDGGAAQPNSAAFERALGHLQNAIQYGQQAGESDIVTAARAGLAQVHVGLGNWSDAVAAAEQVPTDFVFNATQDGSDLPNETWVETHDRHEMSAYNTLAGATGGTDPRAPWTDCTVDGAPCTNPRGADGETPHYRQEKFPSDDSDIAAAKGAEMRLIQAENQIRNGTVDSAVALMNAARSYYGVDPMDPDTITDSAPSSFDINNQAWSILDDERHLTLWLEGRRLHDLRRWNHPFLNGGSIVYPGISERASCYPISQNECDVNDNITCS